MAYVIALLLAALAGCGGEVRTSVPPAPAAIQVEDTASAVVVRSAAASIRIDKASAGLTLAPAASCRWR